MALLGTILSQPRRGYFEEGYPGGIRGHHGIRHGGYRGYRGPTFDFGIHTGGYGGAGYGK